MKILLSFLLATSILFLSCNSNNSIDEDKPIAKAYDKHMYLSDIIIPLNTNSTDSEQIVNASINTWLIEQIKLHKAEINLTASQKDIEDELEEYRSSLLIYKYEQKYIKQKLVTNVTLDEIQTYYDKHLSELKLKNNVIKVSYVCIPIKSKNYYAFRSWFTGNYERNIDKIANYCEENALIYQTFDDNWISFNQFLKVAPFTFIDQKKYLKAHKNIGFNDSENHYLAIFHNYKLKGDIAPLNIVSSKIRNILLNKRKLKLIRNFEENSLKDALNLNEVEKY